MAAAPPALPPGATAPVMQPQEPQSVMMQGVPPSGGQAGMQAVKMLQAKIQELDKWAGDVKGMIEQIHPPLGVFLQPIAQAAMDLNRALGELGKRSGMEKGSPEVPATPAPNPAAGPPDPAVL